MLKLNKVSKSYTDRDGKRNSVLRELDFEIKAGEMVSFLGESGSGKTTLLKVIASLLKVDEGSVEFSEGKKPKLGYMFQTPTLLPWKSVLENVQLPIRKQNDVSNDKAMNCLKRVGLEKFKNYLPNQLSGGMKARACLAQILFLEPDLFMMDEPFSSLDEIHRNKMNEDFIRIWESTKSSAIFVTHNIGEAVFMSDRVIIVSQDTHKKSIIAEVAVKFARPRIPELRRTHEFNELVENIRDILREAILHGVDNQ